MQRHDLLWKDAEQSQFLSRMVPVAHMQRVGLFWVSQLGVCTLRMGRATGLHVFNEFPRQAHAIRPQAASPPQLPPSSPPRQHWSQHLTVDRKNALDLHPIVLSIARCREAATSATVWPSAFGA
jgi:hypothetical protein